MPELGGSRNSLQHTATHYIHSTLLHAATHCHTLQHTATLCIRLQHTATPTAIHTVTHFSQGNTLHHTATRRNPLPLTATHCHTLCNTLYTRQQRTASRCNTLQPTATQCHTLPRTAKLTAIHYTQGNILHHTAARCNTLQQPATQLCRA